MNLSTLASAATLKGYLMATDAPKDIIALAEHTVAEIITVLAGPGVERVANEDVQIPLPFIGEVPDGYEPRLTETHTRIPTETPQGEEKVPMPAGGDAAGVENASVTTGGASRGKRGGHEWTNEQREAASNKRLEFVEKRGPLIADSELSSIKQKWEGGKSFDNIGKSYGCSGTSVRNFLQKHGIDPRRSSPGVKHGGTPALTEKELEYIIGEKAKGTPSTEIGEALNRSQHAIDQKYSDLKKAGRVPEEHLSTEALKEKKKRQNALVSAKMKEFHATKSSDNGYIGLRAEQQKVAWYPDDWADIQVMLANGTPKETIASDYGVTLEQLDVFVNENSTTEVDEDEWPAAVKPEKKMSLVAEAKAPDEPARMKFRKKTVRDTWGNVKEVESPVPSGKYKDPETGKKVTTYPPGYAIGTHPQRNLSVKGGS